MTDSADQHTFAERSLADAGCRPPYLRLGCRPRQYFGQPDMPEISGGCYCGNVGLVAAFSQDLAAFDPRVCDCDFCRKHAAAYVSDPVGSLRIQIRDDREVHRFRQGSNTAEMLLCRTCGVLVGALYRESHRLFGTVNVRVLDSRVSFGPERGVSPKLLSPNQKVQRWRDIWFPDVRLDIEGSS